MTQAKHTPGPWIIEAVAGWLEIQNEETLYTVAKINGNGAGPQANAALIAAAPELLEALQKLLLSVRSNNEGGSIKTPDQIFAEAGYEAIAAIAKATGSAE